MPRTTVLPTAWEKISDVSMLRRTLDWKAVYLAFTMGQPEQGLSIILRAVHLADAGDPVEQASAWKTAGFIQTDLADYSAGWQDYANALRLFAETGDRFNQEVLFENRGKLLQMTGDYEGALQDENDAIAMARDLQRRDRRSAHRGRDRKHRSAAGADAGGVRGLLAGSAAGEDQCRRSS